MMRLGPLTRAAALVSVLFSAGPVFAGQADIDLLKSYLGNWKGRGTLVGANTESVTCKLTLSAGNNQKINYSGRCAMAGSNLSINGTLAYVDAAKRYEAVMTSNASFSGVAIGRRQGDGVVFNLKERDRSDNQDMAITAGIALQGGKIKVDFLVIDAKTGDQITATIPFSM